MVSPCPQHMADPQTCPAAPPWPGASRPVSPSTPRRSGPGLSVPGTPGSLPFCALSRLLHNSVPLLAQDARLEHPNFPRQACSPSSPFLILPLMGQALLVAGNLPSLPPHPHIQTLSTERTLPLLCMLLTRLLSHTLYCNYQLLCLRL